MWAPFGYGIFRAIWIAALVSNIGTWMQNVAGVWLITTLTTSTVLVALMQTATSLPVFLLSVPAGAFADILDRRRILLFTQSFMAVVALVLGALTLMGLHSAWLVLGFTFLLGVGAALNGPTWQAIAPELVPRPVLPAALTLNGVSLNLARAVGPALGGLIIARYSPGYVFLLNGLSFLGTLAVVYGWRRETAASSLPVESFLSALRAGVRYVRFSPSIQAILVRAAAFTFGSSAMWALLSLVIARRLHLSSGTYGLMLSWLGAGAVTGAFVVNRLNQRLSPDQRILLATTLFVGVNAALALVDSLYVLSAVMYGAGIAWIMVMTSFNVSIQLHLPRWVQARVLSMYLLVFQGGMAFGSVAWGTVSDHYGLQTALLAAAAWLGVSLLLALPFKINSAEGFNLTPALTWPEPVVDGEIDPDAGPVVVMIEYRVNPADLTDFLTAFEPLKRLRRRDGASRIGIFTDVADPTRQVEFFTVHSWGEHLRQHERFTQQDRLTEEAVRRFHQAPEPPRVTHFVAETADRRLPVVTPPFEAMEGT
jgi:MFS family permease